MLKYIIILLCLSTVYSPMYGQISGNSTVEVGFHFPTNCSEDPSQGKPSAPHPCNFTPQEPVEITTSNEGNPYWEATFDHNITFNTIIINEDFSVFPNGMSNYYIFTSRFPFTTENLDDQIGANCVDHIKIQQSQLGRPIPLPGMQGQYMRIQLATPGTLGEIGTIPSGVYEICGNGIDDNCNGAIDCEDVDCGVDIFNTIIDHPTCPNCNDGFISIQAFSSWGAQIQISMDGGNTFFNSNGLLELSNLDEGDYTIIITSGECPTEVTFTLVAPIIPEGTPCDNGGFENGFDGWNPEKTKFGEGDFSSVDDPADDPGFDILDMSEDNEDTNFPGGSVYSPTGGDRVAVLGEIPLSGQQDLYKITNCFLVDENNADFAFNYSLILPNPEGHSNNELPKFTWRITTDDSDEIIEENTIIAGNDEFFEINEDNGNSVKGWTAECIELQDFIGQTICIEFIIQECRLGGHGAYAYIDGICADSETNIPNCDFDIDSEFLCFGGEGENIDVLGIIFESNVNNYDHLNINICDQAGNCTGNQLIESYLLKELDIIKLASDGGLDLIPGRKYSAEIELENDCGSCTKRVEFEFLDVDMSMNYPSKILVCGNPTNIVIPGSSACDNCTYEWSPSVNMGNPNSANPILDGTTNTSTYTENYTVTMTYEDEEGRICKNDASIQLYDEVPLEFSCEFSRNSFCDVDFECTITSPFIIKPSDFEFIGTNAGRRFDISVTSINPNEVQLSYSLINDVDLDISILYKYTISDPSVVIVGGNCTLSGYIHPNIVPRSPFFNSTRIYHPIVFTPNGDGVNEFWFPQFNLNSHDHNPNCLGSPIISATLEIFNRWGNKVHTISASVPVGSESGLTGQEIAWDGMLNGLPASEDTFLFILTVTRGCVADNFCNDNGSFCNAGDTYYCNSAMSFTFSGDITLIR